MRTLKISAATLLLLVIYLTTDSSSVNGQVVDFDAKKENDGSQGTTVELLIPQRPGRIDNAFRSVAENRDDVSRSENLDQQVDQSETVIFAADDATDMENIQHALSIVEYEPQKIHAKKKRRSDLAVSTSENTDVPAPNVENIFYEVPRTVQSKRISQNPAAVVTPKHYSRPGYDSQKSFENEAPDPATAKRKQRLEGRDIDYVYPVPPAAKLNRQRLPKPRSQLHGQISSPAEETKLENAPNSRATHLHRSHPSLFSETRRPKPYVEPTVPTTPSGDTLHSTRATRRKKSRKRVAETVSNDSAREANYPAVDVQRVRGSIGPEARNKARRVGLVAKYDVAPRPFARSQPAKVQQENTSEKSNDEGAAASGTRGSNNRNPYPNALRSNDDSNRSPLISLNRKLYERKLKSSSVTEKTNPEEYQNSDESLKIGAERLVPQYRSEEAGPSTDRSLETTPLQSVYETGLDVFAKVPSSTPSVVAAYQNIKAPVVTLHSGSSGVSSVLPFTSPSPYTTFYPSVVSTLAPVQHFELSTVLPWIPQSKFKERDVDISEPHQKAETSDGVAEATSYGSGEDSGSEQGKYEIHENPEEGHGGGAGNHGGHDQGDNSRQHSGEYDRKNDARGESSHHSAEGSKEGAVSGDGKGKQGGDGKFEHGVGTEREEGHVETEGDRGHKGYKSWHEHEKDNKGHHDKERHSNFYGEKDGKEKEHKEDGEYHEEHHEGEKAEKQAEFGEKGEHQKGYSTKGQHSVHKKDEFEKRTEFFDEFHEDGDLEKDGEYYEEHESSKGGHEKVSHRDEGDHEEKYGKASKHEKGEHHRQDKGHKTGEGEDSHYDRDKAQGKKQSQHTGKKWSYAHGDKSPSGEGDRKPKR